MIPDDLLVTGAHLEVISACIELGSARINRRAHEVTYLAAKAREEAAESLVKTLAERMAR